MERRRSRKFYSPIKSDHACPITTRHFEGFIALVDNKIKREPPAEAAKGHEFSGDVSWAGFGHTYFFFALLPDNGAAAQNFRATKPARLW